MSYTDDTSDQDWRETKTKTRKSIKQESNNTPIQKQKYYQRFCEKWLKLFTPWLARCEDDPNKPFCRACQCRLDCNRCHLQRHERTTKHARNLEILVSKGESAARENLSIRQERSKYYQRRKKLNTTQDLEASVDEIEEYVEVAGADGENNLQFVQSYASGDQYSDEQSMNQADLETPNEEPFAKRKLKERTNTTRLPVKKSGMEVKQDRDQLLIQVKQNKTNIMESFKDLITNGSGITLAHSQLKERNTVDLFFDSVSSSVKALPLKLVAEAKMRVSQLICELELRALTEFDGNQTNMTNSLIMSTGINNSCIEGPNTAGIHQTEEESKRAQYVNLS